MFPSFPSLRERNLITLYGDTKVSGDFTDKDKSPKGSVDYKIRPLVDLINRHPEYVTLSSCSGRVALFDPTGVNVSAYYDGEDKQTQQQQQVKGTEISGKGRGKWILVTHDIEANLGEQIIYALKKVGRERFNARCDTSHYNCNDNDPPITFKHEPPLLHVGAASLEAGKKLLHIAKSICAMRESGLVVTEQRVTVELRTTGTLLCLPLMIQLITSTKDKEDDGQPTLTLFPSEEYLKPLADMANERMVQNEVLLDKLYNAVQDGLFEQQKKDEPTNDMATNGKEVGVNYRYNITLQPLPNLNLWKTASVVMNKGSGENSNNNDVDVIAFGGQGIGPDMMTSNIGKASTCRRWETIFRLQRKDGFWSDRWGTLPVINDTEDIMNSSENSDISKKERKFITSVGIFRVNLEASIGPREGHTACILPSSLKSDKLSDSPSSSTVMLFGGRIGGPMSPTNDTFLFTLSAKTESKKEVGAVLGRPVHIRGTFPEPRFGHTMLALHSNNNHLAVIAGGTGIDGSGKAISLTSVHTLSRVTDSESEYSHFIWDRLSDMPSPRSYHASFIDEKSNCMFVFGGVAADDPFTSSGDELSSKALQIELLQNESNTSCYIVDEPPALIGGSAATLSMDTNDDVILVVGGTKSPNASVDSDQEDNQSPITIFTNIYENRSKKGLVRAKISSIKVVNDRWESDTLELGSCVHHCLVTLPKSHNDTESSAIIVGGGVPSFSFGQSYARSYMINITRNSQIIKPSTADKFTSRRSTKSAVVTTANLPVKDITGKSTIEVDVVYVKSRQAKLVKNKLESLGFLEKRCKLVKVEHDLIAVPVKEKFNIDGTRDETLSNLIIRSGREKVPFSSSAMSKLKQTKRL